MTCKNLGKKLLEVFEEKRKNMGTEEDL